MKKIYITGSKGMVGSRFLELLPKDYIALTPEADRLDITDKEAVFNFFKQEKPEIVVHFAAFTNVNEAENQRGDKNGTCWKINVEGSKNLAEACKEVDAHLIQISTDNVFPGSKEEPGPYKEDHKPGTDSDKLVWYGYTKAESEREIAKILGSNVTILRIIYPFRARFDAKLDYVRKPLSLFDEGKLYPMFTDQQITVTFVDEICMALFKIIELDKRGIFHACSSDTTTPFELTSYLIEKARGVKNAVKPSSIDEFLKTVDNPVRYPKYGGLNVEKTEKELGIKFSTWKQMVDEFISQNENS